MQSRIDSGLKSGMRYGITNPTLKHGVSASNNQLQVITCVWGLLQTSAIS